MTISIDQLMNTSQSQAFANTGLSAASAMSEAESAMSNASSGSSSVMSMAAQAARERDALNKAEDKERLTKYTDYISKGSEFSLDGLIGTIVSGIGIKAGG